MNKYNNSFRKLAWFKLTGENDKNFKHYNLVCSLMGIFFCLLFSVFITGWKPKISKYSFCLIIQ